MNPIYFIDETIINEIFFQNSFALIKLLLVTYILFYYIPRKIFPQPKTSFQIEIIVINMIYMVSYVEIFITLFIYLKIFSIPMFLILLVATKFFFIKYYEKKDPFKILKDVKISFMIKTLDILDNPQLFYQKLVKNGKDKILNFQKKITFYNVLSFIFYFGVISYIFIETMTRGLESVSYSIADTGQFVDWVNHLHRNILYEKIQAGADMYGISILIFFIHTFTNIDVIILFSIYPTLLFLALYLAIFYVLRDFTKSNFVAIFGVMFHGIILMSPLALDILGGIVQTNHPFIDYFGIFSYYVPTKEQLQNLIYFPLEAYYRYASGMAYEHASVFVLLNAYFLIKLLQYKTNKYLILYTLTLLLVFTFHGGGAIPLLVISILITLNGFLFLKIDKSTFKKGLLAVLFATIVGNIWMFSMVKYGIPKDFGAAAPFLDKLLNTKQYAKSVVEMGIFDTSFMAINKFHYFLIVLFIFNFILFLFRKEKFVNLSFLMIILGVFIIYFGPTFGFPNVASFLRLSEYFFLAITLLVSITFYYICKILPKIVILSLLYFLLIFSILAVPKWINSKEIQVLINKTEWTAIPEFIVKINQTNLRYSWSFISYVQDYTKVRNKGYHINVDEFLLKYSPLDKYLKIGSQKVFIAVEDFTHPYKGLNEWYYRWRSRIQSNLKAWISTYSMHHNNIKIAYRSKLVTIYEIDNQEYINYLIEKEKQKEKGKK